jgi:hypothetical protein
MLLERMKEGRQITEVGPKVEAALTEREEDLVPGTLGSSPLSLMLLL